MRWLLFAVVLVLPALAFAVPPVGGPLPRLTLSGDEAGSLRVADDTITYARFDSARAIGGKPTIVVYVAARTGARDMSNALKAELGRVKPGRANYDIITIVDFDDCMFGTCGIGLDKLGEKKKKRPWVHYVADSKGLGRTRWGTKEESFTAFLLDAKGTILWVHEGMMSAAQAQVFVGALVAQFKP